jgi:microcystin-dependent protein
MVTLTHPFVSGKADGTDTTLVKPTNWNAEHKFETAADNILLGRAVGTGPGPVQELPFTSVFPPGMIMPYAGAGTPGGWLRCEAQILNRADYDPLFQVISTNFNLGGETAAQFRLPDLRGRVIAGLDAVGAALTQPWFVSGASPAVLGARGGSQVEQAAIGGIGVGVSVNGSGSTLAGIIVGNMATDAQSQGGTTGDGGTPGYSQTAHTHVIGSHNHAIAVNSGVASGSGSIVANSFTGAQTNIPPTLILYYLIKT